MTHTVTINEQLKLELRRVKTGYGVLSTVPTNWGGTATNQVFWSEHEREARAFIQGAQMMAALTK